MDETVEIYRAQQHNWLENDTNLLEILDKKIPIV